MFSRVFSTVLVFGHRFARPGFAKFSSDIPTVPWLQTSGTRVSATTQTPITGLGDKSILDHLLKTEAEANDFYSELASKVKDKGFKAIFEMLAIEERRHVHLLKELAAGIGGKPVASAANCPVSALEDINREIATMKERRKYVATLSADQLELYRAAREMEAQSRDFYAMCATVATDPDLKRLLTVLADEEEKHCAVLDGLVQFLSEQEKTEADETLMWDDALNLWINMNGPLAKMGKA